MTENKRVLHLEVDARAFVDVDGLNRGLVGLARQAEDSYDFEDILNGVLLGLYQNLLNGEKNYGRNNQKLGFVCLNRLNAGEEGKSNIFYVPSVFFNAKLHYVKQSLGKVDLRKRTFLLSFDGRAEREDYYEIPEQVMRDTERVLPMLGLKKEDKK